MQTIFRFRAPPGKPAAVYINSSSATGNSDGHPPRRYFPVRRRDMKNLNKNRRRARPSTCRPPRAPSDSPSHLEAKRRQATRLRKATGAARRGVAAIASPVHACDSENDHCSRFIRIDGAIQCPVAGARFLPVTRAVPALPPSRALPCGTLFLPISRAAVLPPPFQSRVLPSLVGRRLCCLACCGVAEGSLEAALAVYLQPLAGLQPAGLLFDPAANHHGRTHHGLWLCLPHALNMERLRGCQDHNNNTQIWMDHNALLDTLLL
nr:unnamed protein product [Digitaria exilis]